MRKKLLMIMMCLGLAVVFFNILIREEAENKHQGSSVVRIGDEVVSVYVNGVDFTQEYKDRERKAKESVARYFNKKCSEIRFFNYCMLEMEGMTIEAEIENVEYTFLLNAEGEIQVCSSKPGREARRILHDAPPSRLS